MSLTFASARRSRIIPSRPRAAHLLSCFSARGILHGEVVRLSRFSISAAFFVDASRPSIRSDVAIERMRDAIRSGGRPRSPPSSRPRESLIGLPVTDLIESAAPRASPSILVSTRRHVERRVERLRHRHRVRPVIESATNRISDGFTRP